MFTKQHINMAQMYKPFVCSKCEVMVSTEEHLIHQDHYLAFSHLTHTIQIGRQIFCASCSSELGTQEVPHNQEFGFPPLPGHD